MKPEVGWGEEAGYSGHTANVVIHHKTLIVNILSYLTRYCIKIKKLKHKNKKESNNNKRNVKKKRENLFTFIYIYIYVCICLYYGSPLHIHGQLFLNIPLRMLKSAIEKGIVFEYNMNTISIFFKYLLIVCLCQYNLNSVEQLLYNLTYNIFGE